MLKLTICICLVAVVQWGSTTSAKNIAAKAGYCHYDGLKIKEGETVPAPLGKCQTYTCKSAEPEEISLSLSCAWEVAPGSKCHQSVMDLTKQYPDCCPQEDCPED